MITRNCFLGTAFAIAYLLAAQVSYGQWSGTLNRGIPVEDSAYITAAYPNGEGGATLILSLENRGNLLNGIFEVMATGAVEFKWRSEYPMFLLSPTVPGDEGTFWTTSPYGPAYELLQLDPKGLIVPDKRTNLWMPPEEFNSLITDHEGGTYLLHTDSNFKSYQVSRFDENGTPVWDKPLVVDTLVASNPNRGIYSDSRGGAYVATSSEDQSVHRISSAGQLIWSTSLDEEIIGIDSLSRMVLRSAQPSAAGVYTLRHLLPSGQIEHFVDLSLPDYPQNEWAGAYTTPSGDLLLISRGLGYKGWLYFGRLISPSGEDLWGDWRLHVTSVMESNRWPKVYFGPKNEGFYLTIWDQDIKKKEGTYLRMQRVSWAGRNEWLEEGIKVATDDRHGLNGEIVVPLEDKVIVAYTEKAEADRPRVLVTALDKQGAPFGTASVESISTPTRLDYAGSRSVRVHDQLGRLVTKFDAVHEELRQQLDQLPRGWYSVSIDREVPFRFVVAK